MMRDVAAVADGYIKQKTSQAALKARRAAKRAGLYICAAVMALIALVYLSVAAFFALQGHLGGPGAALCIGAFFMLLALLIVIVCLLLSNQEHHHTPEQPSASRPVAASFSDTAARAEALIAEGNTLFGSMEKDAKKYAPYLAMAALIAGITSAKK